MRRVAQVALAASATAEMAAALHLTEENYGAVTAGKSVFLKFYAPWCGHCKAMAPAWEELMADYANSSTSVVAEVDCTDDSARGLCEGVQGFPTVKHGNPDALEDYQGGRDLESLRAFAESNLKPLCGPATLEHCDDEQKSEIELLSALSKDELDAKVVAKEAEIAAADKTFEEELEKLQQAYEKLVETRDSSIKDIKASGLSMMKVVLAHAKKETSAESTESSEDASAKSVDNTEEASEPTEESQEVPEVTEASPEAQEEL